MATVSVDGVALSDNFPIPLSSRKVAFYKVEPARLNPGGLRSRRDSFRASLKTAVIETDGRYRSERGAAATGFFITLNIAYVTFIAQHGTSLLSNDLLQSRAKDLTACFARL